MVVVLLRGSGRRRKLRREARKATRSAGERQAPSGIPGWPSAPAAAGPGWRLERPARTVAPIRMGTGNDGRRARPGPAWLPLPPLGLGLAVVHPSPIFAQPAAGVRQRVALNRYPPGAVRYGFPCNSGGHYDVEFVPKREGQRLVVAIGDSFASGIVPHPFHVTQVCEHHLENTVVHNMGVPAIGPREYPWLLENEALPLAPDVVVIAFFVGNDFTARAGFLRSWLERRNVLSYVVPKRLSTLARRRRRQRPSARGAEAPPETVATDPGELTTRYPWILDPSLERPVFSERAYPELERTRAARACSPSPVDEQDLLGVLERIRAAAAGTRLAFLVIPDEFQVEDGLWTRIQASLGRELERDRPQRWLAAWLEPRRIPYLDALPCLRAVPPGPDGRRGVYHRRDTHWNAHGNRVVGEALAEFLALVD